MILAYARIMGSNSHLDELIIKELSCFSGLSSNWEISMVRHFTISPDGRKVVSVILVLSLFLAGCALHKEETLIQFVETPTENAARWGASWGADEHGVWLVTRLYAVNRNLVFLLGNLRVPGALIRSVLLRSEDGGQRWHEVMQPVEGSDVVRLLFLNGQCGWALVGWTVEGPGELHLFGTSDAGRSWQHLSQIPKRHYVGWPTTLEFQDENHGQLGMLYDGAAPTDGFVVLATSDGGRNWHETHSTPLDDYYAQRETPSQPTYFTAQDGSRWKLEPLSRERTAVLRRGPQGASWETQCVLPTRFGYSAGQVTD